MPVHCHDSTSEDDESLISYRLAGVSAVWAISMLVVIFLHVLYYLRVYAKTTWCLALCVSNGKADPAASCLHRHRSVIASLSPAALRA